VVLAGAGQQEEHDDAEHFVPATPVEPAAVLIDPFGDTPLVFPRKFTVVDRELVRQRPWPADDETVR
jgi:hypothetical protein